MSKYEEARNGCAYDIAILVRVFTELAYRVFPRLREEVRRLGSAPQPMPLRNINATLSHIFMVATVAYPVHYACASASRCYVFRFRLVHGENRIFACPLSPGKASLSCLGTPTNRYLLWDHEQKMSARFFLVTVTLTKLVSTILCFWVLRRHM